MGEMMDQGPDRRKRKHPYRQCHTCTERKRKVNSDHTMPKDNSLVGRTFSFNANFQLRYFSNDSSLIRWENGERLHLYPDFNPHPSGHCLFFSGKKVTAPQVRRCLYGYAEVDILQVKACHALELDAFDDKRFSATKFFAIDCQNVSELNTLQA